MSQSQVAATNSAHTGPRERAILGLTRSCGLQEEGAEALRSANTPTERYPAATLISSNALPRAKLFLSGWACEVRAIKDGRRQIFSFVLPGDTVITRSENTGNNCTLLALTTVECIDVERTVSQAKSPGGQELSQAIERALEVARERHYNQAIRLGRRSAVERVGDLLLELYDRLEAVGMVEDGGFRTALTQEHFADALGLSTVHVNRRLRTLRTKNLATFRFGRVSGFDREGLAALRHESSSSDQSSSPETAGLSESDGCDT